MDLLIAAFFVLTRNAIVYENLLHIPIIIVTGLLGSSLTIQKISVITQWFIPIVSPIQWLLGNSTSFYWYAYIVSLILWIILAFSLGKYLLNKAKENGQGGMI